LCDILGQHAWNTEAEDVKTRHQAIKTRAYRMCRKCF